MSDVYGWVTDSKFDDRITLALFLCLVGCVLAFLCIGNVVSGFVGFGLLALGVGLWLGGFCVLVFGFDVAGFVAEFRRDEVGLGYQLIVFVVGLALFSIVWFALGWPADLVMDAFVGMYTFTGLPEIAFTFARGVVRLLPVIMLFISIFGLWISSNRREEGQFY